MRVITQTSHPPVIHEEQPQTIWEPASKLRFCPLTYKSFLKPKAAIFCIDKPQTQLINHGSPCQTRLGINLCVSNSPGSFNCCVLRFANYTRGGSTVGIPIPSPDYRKRELQIHQQQLVMCFKSRMILICSSSMRRSCARAACFRCFVFLSSSPIQCWKASRLFPLFTCSKIQQCPGCW